MSSNETRVEPSLLAVPLCLIDTSNIVLCVRVHLYMGIPGGDKAKSSTCLISKLAKGYIRVVSSVEAKFVVKQGLCEVQYLSHVTPISLSIIVQRQFGLHSTLQKHSGTVYIG